MSRQIVTTTPDVAGTEWPVPNIALKRQDRTLRSSKPTVHYQLAETPSVGSPQEEILQEQLSQPDNLVLDDVFLPQIAEPDLQLLVPPVRLDMAEDRTLLPEPFSGTPKEDATEFWRRLETYLEYKGSDNGAKLRLATAMLVLTARDWFENLPEQSKDTFAHLKAAFAEKFIQPAILKWQSANDIFTKQQMHSESVDEYATRIKNLGKRVEFNDSTLMFALLNGLKPAIKGQVLAKNPQSFAEAVDGARLAELSVLVSASPTERLITEQLAQMRCDIQQLTGNGTVKDSSLTTLATEGITRSPLSSPRRVRFNEPDGRRSPRPQYVQQRPLRSAPMTGNNMFTRSFHRDQQMSRDGGERRFYDQNSNQQSITTRATPITDPLCPKCGNKKHDNIFRCAAIGKQCWGCSRIGYLRNACRARGRMNE